MLFIAATTILDFNQYGNQLHVNLVILSLLFEDEQLHTWYKGWIGNILINCCTYLTDFLLLVWLSSVTCDKGWIGKGKGGGGLPSPLRLNGAGILKKKHKLDHNVPWGKCDSIFKWKWDCHYKDNQGESDKRYNCTMHMGFGKYLKEVIVPWK